MVDWYREEILDHYKNPRNFGSLADPSVVHEEDNPLCGDRIKIQLRIDNGKLTKVGFTGEGCAISIAAASMLTDHVKGRSLAELAKLDGPSVLSLFNLTDISPARLKCALLPLTALRRALTKGVSS